MHYESLQICLKVLIHLPFTFFVDEVETRGLQSSVKSILPQYLSILSINEILQIIPKYDDVKKYDIKRKRMKN